MAELIPSNRTRVAGDVATDAVLLSKVDADIPTGLPAGLNVGVAGTANLITARGRTLTNYPLQSGYNPLSISRLLPGGTADDIWALY